MPIDRDLLDRIPIDQLAQRLGADRSEVEDAVHKALPSLLGGMQANAQDPQGAASLLGALQTKDPQLVEGGVDLDQVDEEDGRKIVHNVFGDRTDDVVSKLGSTGGGGGLVGKLLPMLAPIVMAYLAKRLGGGGAASGPAAGGGGLGGALGGLLGGSGGGGGGLGDLLGGMLGGGGSTEAAGERRDSGGGFDMGSVLGGLLGGGKR